MVPIRARRQNSDRAVHAFAHERRSAPGNHRRRTRTVDRPEGTARHLDERSVAPQRRQRRRVWRTWQRRVRPQPVWWRRVRPGLHDYLLAERSARASDSGSQDSAGGSLMPPLFRSQTHSSILVPSRRGGVTRNQVVCSLDRLIVTQDSSLTTAGVQLVDGKMDLSVYADVVDIRGPILLPDRSVKIFARKLCSSVDSRNQPARIDTSGLSAGAAAGREQKKAKLSPAYGGETCVTALGFHMGCEKQGGDGKTGDPGK